MKRVRPADADESSRQGQPLGGAAAAAAAMSTAAAATTAAQTSNAMADFYQVGAIHKAVFAGDIPALKEKLENPQNNPDEKDMAGNTPMHVATKLGNVEAVEALIAARAKTYSLNIQGKSPLYMAVENGHEAIVELLCKAGASIVRSNHQYKLSPLQKAIVDKNLGLVKIMLEHGSVVSLDVETLKFAFTTESVELFEIFIDFSRRQGLKPSYLKLNIFRVSNPLIFSAGQQSYSAIAVNILNAGYKLKPSVIMLALDKAYEARNYDVVEAIFANYKKEVIEVLKSSNRDCNKVLQSAVIESVERFISIASSEGMVLTDDQKYTLLDAAIRREEGKGTNSAIWLLDSGADVNKRGIGSLEAIEMLEPPPPPPPQLNIAPQAPRIELITPLAQAVLWGDVTVVAHILDTKEVTQANLDQALLYSVTRDNAAVTRLLLRAGANVNTTDRVGNTPLLIAARLRESNIETIRLLVEHGADTEAVNKKRENVYHMFFKKGEYTGCDYDLIQLLRMIENPALLEGAFDLRGREPLLCINGFAFGNQSLRNRCELTVKNFIGKALDIPKDSELVETASSERFSRAEVAYLIHIVGIDVNRRLEGGKTMLHYASSTNNVLAIRELLDCGADINVLDNAGNFPVHYASEVNTQNMLGYNLQITLETTGRTQGPALSS